MRKKIFFLFNGVLRKLKTIYLRFIGSLRRNRNRPAFYEIAIAFFIMGCLEILFRILWQPTPISFLFPLCILIMYFKITQRTVDIRKRWYLLIPFFLFILFLCYFLIFTPATEDDRVWKLCFPATYMVETLICTIPVIIGIQKYLCYDYDSQKILFIQFLSLAQLIGATLLFVMAGSDEQIFIFSVGASETIHSPLCISLTLIVCVFSLLHYLLITKKTERITYPLTVRLKKCNEEVIYLFNEQRIFLNPDLSINMLTTISKVDKADLEFYFNEYIGKSFQYFVAEYRVVNAINLITVKGDRYTLEAIGYESGFRCRASFNKYFKLITGMLPSQYMRMKQA